MDFQGFTVKEVCGNYLISLSLSSSISPFVSPHDEAV